MVVKWSSEQKLAIEARNSNILVSAGAGSGKTAVLTERIISHIREGHSLKNLLVLTFTNAAAEEMKERVRKALIKNKNEKWASDALELVDSALMTTFDGYFLYLVKRYFYKLGVSQDINVADGYYIRVKINEILDEILDELYSANDERLIKFFDTFMAKDDDNLKNNLIAMFYKISIRVDKDKYLDSYQEEFYSKDNLDTLVSKYKEVVYGLISDFKSALYNFLDLLDENNQKIADQIHKDINALADIYTIDGIKEFFGKYKIGTCAKGSVTAEMTAAREKVSELKKDIIKHIENYNSWDEVKLDIEASKDYSALFIKIIKKLDERLYEFKKKYSYFEFGDIARLALNLIDENPDVREEISDSLYEILIDEYQDTSDIQEELILRIARNNVYMVGDVKQSIYRFRNANPYIFKAKYDNYKENDGGLKIDLVKNFRSRAEVLNNINLIFDSAMTNTLGDADFKREHRMNFGLEAYNGLKGSFDMEIINYDINDYTIEVEGKKPKKLYTESEIEAYYVVSDIKRRIDAHEQVYDKDSGTFRDIKYADFCIIADKGTKFEEYKKILESEGIPVALNNDSRLSESAIMPIISSLMNLVVLEGKGRYNEDYYHALYSVGRSFLFEMNDNDLFALVSEAKRNKERVDCEASNIALELSKNMYRVSPTDLYLSIIDNYGISYKLSKIGDVTDSLVVLEYVKDFISGISNVGEGIVEISSYISDLVSGDNDVKYNISVKNAPGVKIMNIHKSKGLEFPICYFLGLSSAFNKSDYKGLYGYFAESGIYVKFDDKISPVREIGIDEIMKKNASEKIRLFYVALTRAREKMILLIDGELENVCGYRDIKSMKSVLSLASKDLDPYIKRVVDTGVSKNYINSTKEKVLSYNTKPMYSLYENKSSIIMRNRISKEVIEVLSDEEQENLDYGNHLHEIMESLDFKNIDISSLSGEDYDIISKVLTNDLFKNIGEAKTYHEHEFYIDLNNKSYHGIIDLLVIYDDHIDIIDYKLKNINHAEYDRQLGIYKDYVASRSNLPIRCYLLSLLENKSREVR